MADSVQYKSLPEVLYCKTCNYYTCNKKQIEKHFISSKHIKNSYISAPGPAPAEEPNASELPSHSDIPLAPPNTPNSIICECCGKTYKNKATFTRHQRTIKQQTIQDNNISLDADYHDHENDKNNNNDKDQENIDKSLELITDDSDSDSDSDDYSNADTDNDNDEVSSTIELDYMTFNPLIINHDVVYFMHAFMYSTNFIMMVYIYFNKICSFFSLKSHDDSD